MGVFRDVSILSNPKLHFVLHLNSNSQLAKYGWNESTPKPISFISLIAVSGWSSERQSNNICEQYRIKFKIKATVLLPDLQQTCIRSQQLNSGFRGFELNLRGPGVHFFKSSSLSEYVLLLLSLQINEEVNRSSIGSNLNQTNIFGLSTLYILKSASVLSLVLLLHKIVSA